MARVDIMSLMFDNVTMDEALEIAEGYLQKGQKCQVVTPNAEIARTCKKDRRLHEIVNRAQLCLPDGVGVVMASKILNKPLKGKVAGVEFGDNLCRLLAQEGKSLFLFGAKPGVADTAAQKLKEKHPGLLIAGVISGYVSDEEAIAAIKAAHADVLFVGTGSPKQDIFISEYIEGLPVTLAIGLGGSLDIYAGVSKRAPDLFIKLGLEWFYRLLKEPKRIGRMLKLPLYLWDAIFYSMKGGE